MSRNWLAVASAEHVEIGRNGGFMQVNHGKATPLRRIQPGDRIVVLNMTEKRYPRRRQAMLKEWRERELTKDASEK